MVAKSMLESMNRDSLIFTPNYFIVLRVTLVTLLLHTNAPIARGITCYRISYIM